MEKQYHAIATKLKISQQAVHLVHYVLKNMKTACVFPPSLNGSVEPFFSPANICSALVAYLHRHHPKDPWGTFKKFGFESSLQIGSVVKEIHDNQETQVVSDWEIEVADFEGVFTAGSTNRQSAVRWSLEPEENRIERVTQTYRILSRHFDGVSPDELVVNKRQFPEHVRADLQIALEQIFEGYEDLRLHGLNQKHAHEGISFQSLTESDKNYQINEYAMRDTENAQSQSDSFFDDLQKRVENSKCYRGKILSFEENDDYRGQVAGVKVHELKRVEREQVILPEKTLELLDRNVIDFVRQRPELKQRGMNLKKGLLFFGPPGTGKTHTVHYLSRALPGTTTLVITSEQIGLLSRYMTLARLLQPSLVIIEDADLIARQREEMGTCEEILLNKLLNEMDGLRADAEIIFVLTTNRPEALEQALTSRPGRIDQAIEFPLPDETGRRQLAKLYTGNQRLELDAIELIVKKTEHTSAAFIKELMRRATQYAIARGLDQQIGTSDIELAVEEMLFSGGAFNRRILGASHNQE